MTVFGDNCSSIRGPYGKHNRITTLLIPQLMFCCESVMRGVRAAVMVSVTLLVFLALGQHTEGKLLAHRHREVL